MHRFTRNRSPERSTHRPNWLITFGIMVLALGLLMIVWGVTSMQEALDVSKNPLLITGMVFFLGGFLTMFTVALHQQLHHTSRFSMQPPLPVYDFQVRLEDTPPHYNECFVIDTHQQDEPPPPPPVDLKTMNDLPTYQDIFGGKKQIT